MRWTMTSVSIVDWKIAPPCSSSWRMSTALTRLPLWATAIDPKPVSTTNGWAFLISLDPAVE